MASGEQPTEFIDMLCTDVADSFVNEAAQMAWGMVGNAGQEALVSDIEGDIYSSWDDVYNGTGGISIESDHPEAIGIICEVVSLLLEVGAGQCRFIRETTTWADVF